ncbi:8757_t:CDS:2, partial [Racocetra fulgida]
MGQSSSSESPRNWTSGNPEIDKFIQYSQDTSTYPLEWISYHEFSNIKKVGLGGFASVYSAYWEEIYGVVALKVLKGSQNISDEFMNEVFPEAGMELSLYDNPETSSENSSGISSTSNSGGVYGVLPYIAPELLRGGQFTKATDIYSFGIIMWEISSGKPVYSDREHDVSLKWEIIDGLRPKIAENTPKCYEELMKMCWDKDHNKRPTVE